MLFVSAPLNEQQSTNKEELSILPFHPQLLPLRLPVSALHIVHPAGILFREQAEEPPTTTAVPEAGIHTIVVTGDLDALRQHIQAGSDLDEMEPSRASTPLITAAFVGNADAARLLIDAGANMDYQNDDGSTALHTAAVFGKTDVAELLISAGAELDVPSKPEWQKLDKQVSQFSYIRAATGFPFMPAGSRSRMHSAALAGRFR